MKAFLAIPLILAGMQWAARADDIPPGTQLAVRPDVAVSVNKWDRGRIYRRTWRATFMRATVTSRFGQARPRR